MNDAQGDEGLVSAHWKEYYRDLLRSESYSLQNVLLSLTTEFMQPLLLIRGCAEYIRDYMPVTDVMDEHIEGEVRTSRDVLEMILKCTNEQLAMFNYVRFEVWRDEEEASSDSEGE